MQTPYLLELQRSPYKVFFFLPPTPGQCRQELSPHLDFEEASGYVGPRGLVTVKVWLHHSLSAKEPMGVCIGRGQLLGASGG